MEQTIIDKERYQVVSKLLSGSEEDLKLAINIVDNCNIPESFVHILLLIGDKYDHTYGLSTPLIRSKNFYTYLIKIIGGANNLKLGCDLDEIIRLYISHCEHQGISTNNQEMKYLTLNFKTENKNNYFSNLKKTNLKPRKHAVRNRPNS